MWHWMMIACCWCFHWWCWQPVVDSVLSTMLSWTECRGQDVTLECHSEAFPKSINFWVNNKGAMLVSSKHHHHHHNNDKYKDCETIFLTLLPNFQIQNTKQWVLTAGTRSWTLLPKLPSVLSALSLSYHYRAISVSIVAKSLQLSMCTGLHEVTHPQHHQRGLHGVSLRGEKLSGRLRWLYYPLW